MSAATTGFVLFGHGSRVEDANESVRSLSAQMACSGGYTVEPAFLELGEPDLAGAVTRLVNRGASRIVVVPYFLTLGTHLQRDLPRLVAEVSQVHGEVEIRIAPPLDGHPGLLEAVLDRADSAAKEGEAP